MVKIVFQFIGGPNDGTVLRGALGEPSDAERFYLFSNHGTIGHRLKVASNYAVETLVEEKLNEDIRHDFQRHYYIVTDRRQEGNTVVVRAEYIPQRSEPR